MNTYAVECFLKAAELGSFSGAAKAMYVAQPTVSRLIRELEEELGVKLFDRTNRNHISLTEAGRIYREAFSSMMSQLWTAKRDAQAVTNQNQRSFRIGVAVAWAVSSMVSACREGFQQQLPSVRPVFQAAEFSALLQGLEQGRYDLIFCPQTAVRDTQRFEALLVAQVPEIIILSANNPLANRENLTPRDLRDETLYVLPEEEAPLFRQIYRKGSLAMGYMQPTEDQPDRATIELLLGTGHGCTVYDSWCRHWTDPNFRCVPTGSDIPICAVFARDSGDRALTLAVELIKQWIATERPENVATDQITEQK